MMKYESIILIALTILVALCIPSTHMPDTETYYGMAMNFVEQGDFTLYLRDWYIPVTKFPPLYPTLLSAGLRLGWSLDTSARGINALAMGALVGVLMEFMTGVRPALRYAVVSYLFLGSVRLFLFDAATETLFMALTFAAILAFVQRRATLSALLAGLAVMTRYAGIVWIALALLQLAPRWRLVRRYALLSLPPLVLWCARNMLYGYPPLGERGGGETLGIISQEWVEYGIQFAGEFVLVAAVWLAVDAALRCTVHGIQHRVEYGHGIEQRLRSVFGSIGCGSRDVGGTVD